MKRSFKHATYLLVLATVLAATGCTRVGLNRKSIGIAQRDFNGRPAQAVTAGGSVTDRKQTSIGLASKGGVFTSTSFRALVGVQGSLYEN